MKYFKLGGKYALKNSWWLMLMWLLPSVFVGLCCNPFGLIQFANMYPNSTISHFGDIFAILMPVDWLKFVFLILGILLVSVFLSMVFGQTESHMRSGKLSFKELFSYVNNNVLVVLVNVVFLELINLAVTFLFGCVSFLIHITLSGLANPPTVISSVVVIIIACAVLITTLLLDILFFVNIPNMISNGYSLKEGISSTAQLIGKNTFSLLLAYLIPYVVIIPLVSLLCKTGVAWLANILSFLILTVFYSALTMTAYFELSDTNRYDNRKYYNYK